LLRSAERLAGGVPAVFLTPLFCGSYHRTLICLGFSSLAESATPRSGRHGPRPLRLGTAWLASCVALSSCALGAASKPSASTVDPELAAQLRAMANRQAELERKVDRLQGELDALRATPRPKAA